MDFRRKTALWSLGIGVLFALLAAGPAVEEYTSRTDFAAGTLDTREASVEEIVLESGESEDGRWYSQEIRFRVTGGGSVTKPANGEYVRGIEEGQLVTLGFSRGVLVTVEDTYVRPHPYVLHALTPFVAGAFVLAAIYGLLPRDRWLRSPGPYTAGYVTQGMVLCGVFGLLVDRPWWPAAATVVGIAVPLLICAVRFRRADVTPTARP